MNGRHIVMVSRTLPFHSQGGMQAVAWDLARQFVREGSRVTCLTTRIPASPAHFTAEGVQVVALKDAPAERYTRAWWRASRAYFERHLSAEDTCVLSVSAGAYGLLPLRQRMPRVPFILQAHGTSVGEIASKWRLRTPRALAGMVRNAIWLARDVRAYAQFDRVIAVGATVERDLRKPPIAGFLRATQVETINNGIAADHYAPDAERRLAIRRLLGLGTEPVVISVSRLHPQKGLTLGLRAFAALRATHARARYLIVGEGPEEPSLRRLVGTLGLAGQVNFLGRAERDSVRDYLAAADCFLFTTTHQEGLPLNVLESLAAGLPCVVSGHLQHVVGISDAIAGVDPTNAQDVAQALRQALSLGQQTHSLLPEDYTLTVCARRYDQAFEQCKRV